MIHVSKGKQEAKGATATIPSLSSMILTPAASSCLMMAQKMH
jgi:hypothetical protein